MTTPGIRISDAVAPAPLSTTLPAILVLCGLSGLILLAPFASILVPRALGALPVVTAVVVVAAWMAEQRQLPPLDRGLLLALSGFLLWAAASALWALDPTFVGERVFKTAYLALCGLCLHAIVNSLPRTQRYRLALAGLGAFLLSSLFLLEELYSNYALYRAVRGLDASASIHLYVFNRAAVVLAVLVWPVTLTLSRLIGRWPALLLPLAVAGLILRTESQSALVGMLTGMVVCGLGLGLPVRLVRRGLAVGMVLGALSAPWIAHGLHVWQPSALANWHSASGGERMEIWDAVSGRILEKPWFGWGLEAIRFMPDLIADNAVYMHGRPNTLHPHNGPLQVWVELGVVGVVAALGIVLLLLRRIARLPDRPQAMALATFATVAIMASISHGLWQSWWLGLIGVATIFVSLGTAAIAPDEPLPPPSTPHPPTPPSPPTSSLPAHA